MTSSLGRGRVRDEFKIPEFDVVIGTARHQSTSVWAHVQTPYCTRMSLQILQKIPRPHLIQLHLSRLRDDVIMTSYKITSHLGPGDDVTVSGYKGQRENLT